nr:hypothetical protein [Tanacetum cinerariifolium]
MQKGFLGLGGGGGNHKKKDVGKLGESQHASNVIGSGNNSDSANVIGCVNQISDTIVVAMPKLVGEGFYMCIVRVEYEWKPLTCLSCKNGASTSGKKKQAEVSRQKISNSNSFDALNFIENDDDLGTNGRISKSPKNGSLNVVHGSSSNTPIIDNIDKLKRQMLGGKLMFMDDDGNPLVPTGNVDSKSEVEVVFGEIENLMASMSFKGGSDRGYGTNSLLEQ